MERLAQAVEEALPEEAELVEARFSGGPVLTLLVDRDGGEVDHEYCVKVASTIGPALEEAGFDGPVEISSPGIERPLTKPDHFKRFIGHEAKIKVTEPIDGQRNFTGTIERVGESGFVLKLLEGGAEVELPFGSVTRAYLREDIRT